MKKTLEQRLKSTTPISVIVGLDRFANERYVQGAYLDRDTAQQVMKKISPNGDPGLCDLYSIITTTPATIKKQFDTFDCSTIYEKLRESYGSLK